MMKIKIENDIIRGTAHEIVQQLKLEDWTEYRDKNKYKKNMARRVKMFHGKKIKYKDDVEFLNELQRVGFIEIIEKEVI